MKNSSPHYYHCASKGFDHCILFANEREFIAGMNRIALCRAKITDVIVIAFCLMDNHIHFILYGTREACLRWLRLYQKLTMMWQRNHREGAPVDETWEYDAWQIYDEEDLKRKIAYVFRNPTVAKMGFVPGGYRWCSAWLVFSDAASRLQARRRVGTLSSYESRRLFETRIDLPEDWSLLPDGLIWPGDYTETARVEKLFGHPRNFLFYLNQNHEAEINWQMYQDRLSLPDTDIVMVARGQSEKLFGTQSLASLDIQSRLQLCKLIKKKTGASLKQLARVFHLPLSDLKMIFD